MVSQKTKIVLDADVINHFAKGGLLPLLPKIFPEFQYFVLDVVRRELPSLILPLLEKQVTKEKADSFVADVRSKGSRLPRVDFVFYFCDKI